MKQLNIVLFACLALMPFTQVSATTSALNQSINVIDTILSSSKVQNTISQNESVVEVKRTSSYSDEDHVTYEITTRTPSDQEGLHLHHGSCDSLQAECTHHLHLSHDIHVYTVRVAITPNPLIGPPVVTVESVKKASSHLHVAFDNIESFN